MSRRAFAGAGAAAIGAATAVTALVLGSVTGHAQDDGSSSAFGLKLSGLIDQTISEAASDGTQQDSLLELPDDLPIPVEAEVLSVTAEGSSALAKLAGVNVADEVIAKAVEVSCDGDSGTTTLVGLEIPGADLDESFEPEPNTTVIPEPLDEVAQVTLNRQTTNDDGSVTIDGIVIDLVGDTQQVIIGSATCGGPGGADDGGSAGGADDGGADDGGADDGGDDGSTATSPAPITTGLPVTG